MLWWWVEWDDVCASSLWWCSLLSILSDEFFKNSEWFSESADNSAPAAVAPAVVCPDGELPLLLLLLPECEVLEDDFLSKSFLNKFSFSILVILDLVF